MTNKKPSVELAQEGKNLVEPVQTKPDLNIYSNNRPGSFIVKDGKFNPNMSDKATAARIKRMEGK